METQAFLPFHILQVVKSLYPFIYLKPEKDTAERSKADYTVENISYIQYTTISKGTAFSSSGSYIYFNLWLTRSSIRIWSFYLSRWSLLPKPNLKKVTILGGPSPYRLLQGVPPPPLSSRIEISSWQQNLRMIKFVSYFTSYLLYVFLFLCNEGNYFGMTGAMAATLTVKIHVMLISNWITKIKHSFSFI